MSENVSKKRPPPTLSTVSDKKLTNTEFDAQKRPIVNAVNENSAATFVSYPRYLWITWCKILFTVGGLLMPLLNVMSITLGRGHKIMI